MASVVKAAKEAASEAVRPLLNKKPVTLVYPKISKDKVGVVVSAGKMHKAVKVRVNGREWNRDVRKHFPASTNYIVADPNQSLVEGDVVRISSGHRVSKTIRHVVTAIVAPFGAPVNERPPILTPSQLMDKAIRERLLKDVRTANTRNRWESRQRIEEAQKQGIEVPSLEEAMKNVRLMEAKAAEAAKARGEAHPGQAGQLKESQNERKRRERQEQRREAIAAEKAKEAAVQKEGDVTRSKSVKGRTKVQQAREERRP